MNPKPSPTNNGQPTPAVIRRIEGSEESPRDRFIKKLLPAWVTSGAFNVGFVLLCLLVWYFSPLEKGKTNETIITNTVEKEPEEPVANFDNVDKGLDPNVPTAVDNVEKVTDVNSQGIETQDPPGVTTPSATDSSAFIPAGAGSMSDAPGATGDAGEFMKGTGGESGFQTGAFPGRSASTKVKLIRDGGGNKDSELAVARGLAWLARQQRQDGSWIYDGEHKEDTISATGLSLLPFLAAGYTHKSGLYQRNVKKGLDYLLRNLPVSGPSAGKFSSRSMPYMYVHGIATIALCEAYGMTKDKNLLLAPAQSAINFMQKAQALDGSWGYQPNTPGDTSIVGWQLQALKAAQLSKDIVVDDKVVRNAMKFLDKVGSGSRKSTYGYQGPNGKPGTSLTAVGLLSRYYMDGWGPSNGAMSEGVEGLMTKAPKKSAGQLGDMYFYYYATQVVHFFAGPDWKNWNEGVEEKGQRTGGMRDLLIALQKPEKEVVTGGSWDSDGAWIGKDCGRLGTTCFCLLTLEVYYRHLPLYKRDAGAAK